jgi:hypothetical protein
MKLAVLLMASALTFPLAAGPALSADRITANAKVFVHPMKDGFDTHFKAALEKKKVPVVVVASRDEADYEIKGTSETQKAGAAKKIMLGSWHSDEQASISVAGIKSGEIVFAYSANKKNSAHGKQTTAEACAKHLKEAIEKDK